MLLIIDWKYFSHSTQKVTLTTKSAIRVAVFAFMFTYTNVGLVRKRPGSKSRILLENLFG